MSALERSLYSNPQHVDSVRLTLVSQDVGHVIGAIHLPQYKKSAQVSEEMIASLRTDLKRKYWWLRDEWRERGLPTEQLLIATAHLGFDVYNYSNPLQEEEIERFRQVVLIFSQLKKPIKLGTFLIDDSQTVNEYSNEASNGIGDAFARIVKVEPNARKPVPHRVFEVGNLLGTLVHEAGHFLVDTHSPTDLIREWQDRFGWEKAGGGIITPGGVKQKYVLKDPDRCITAYSRFSPTEDFSDSLVGALFARYRLDPQRLAFLDRELGTDSAKSSDVDSVTVSTRTKGYIRMPRIDQEYFYTTTLGSLFTTRF